ncbi:globin family protein [Spirosoma sp. KNUC1025]|uniref:globin family protein n=1 Tax=Spirosoma sp. KNUC1025 TaxID=2894082 RepID=UPI001E6017D9|nr:globin family protein [Spirosoma sp. KNUC1025]UFH57532.1 globin domain-containing protein [Spirosoma sp. KNUC1025]
MTIEQTRLVRRSFLLLADVAPETVGRVFYHRLFEVAPEVRPLFSRTPLPEQSVKLMTMLTYVVSRLNNLDRIVQDVTALARRHERYGVQEHHYAYVGQALLWTLEQALTSNWMPDVRDAWTACYTLLAETMMAATRPAIASTHPSESYPISYAPGY